MWTRVFTHRPIYKPPRYSRERTASCSFSHSHNNYGSPLFYHLFLDFLKVPHVRHRQRTSRRWRQILRRRRRRKHSGKAQVTVSPTTSFVRRLVSRHLSRILIRSKSYSHSPCIYCNSHYIQPMCRRSAKRKTCSQMGPHFNLFWSFTPPFVSCHAFPIWTRDPKQATFLFQSCIRFFIIHMSMKGFILYYRW